MLDYFFSNNHEGSESLFKELKIWKDDRYHKLQGQFSMLFISFASVKGRDYVIPDDIHYSFQDVVLHRVILGSKSKINGLTGEQVLSDILATVPVPKVQ